MIKTGYRLLYPVFSYIKICDDTLMEKIALRGQFEISFFGKVYFVFETDGLFLQKGGLRGRFLPRAPRTSFSVKKKREKVIQGDAPCISPFCHILSIT